MTSPARKCRLSAVAIVLGGLAGVASAIWVQGHFNSRLPSDLGIYLTAARAASGGGNPYERFTVGASFVYPPSALVLLTPLVGLQYGTARFVWFFASIAAYLGALLMLHRVAWSGALDNARVGSRAASFWVLAAFFAPLWETLSIGQINCFVLLGLALFVRGCVDRRYAALGDFGLAAAVMIKMTPALLFLVPIAQHDWRRVLRIGASLVGLALLSVAFFGWSPWASFVQVIPKLLHGYPGTINQAITPTLSFYLSGLTGTAHLVSWSGKLVSAAVLLAWAVLCLRTRSPRGAVPHLACAGIAAITISSSLIWYHHLIFLIGPLAFLLAESVDRSILLTATLVAIGLIQFDRIIEVAWGLPPLPSIAGYLILFFLSFAIVTRLIGDDRGIRGPQRPTR